jgi:fatty acid desaturase
MDLVIRDPMQQPAPAAPATPRLAERIASRLLCDVRDTAFLELMTLQTLVVVTTGLALFVPGWFSWWLAAAHLAIVLYWIAPFVLMLHNTSHRKFFKRPWTWMNQYIPWVLGPFFGESPETYFAHHVGMHHPENNLEDDLSSTMRFRRDSAVGFARYFLRFLFAILVELLSYLGRKGRRGLQVRAAVGELSFYAAMVGLFFVNWRATLFVFFLPFVISRFAMMAGNWAQHAFIDPTSPENCYRNSITCINTLYNKRCFNDGYHIGHHIKATRHWLEMPEDFLRNVDKYDAEGAIVFQGLDYFQVWLGLMFKRYGWLASHMVQLGSRQRSREELVEFLRSRTLPIVPSAVTQPATQAQ